MRTCILPTLFAALFFATSAVAESNQPNPEAVQAAVNGGVAEANAAWWGFNAEDATAALQAAIDSKAAKVRVPYMGAPWIVRPIALRSGLELFFEPGVVVLAKRGEYQGGGDSVFTASNCKDIVISGYGATVRMWKEDYQKEPYKPAEWRMTLDFAGCTNVRVEGITLENSGGDGIYLGATSAQSFCADVVIKDVVCTDHHRQGISVIGARNLLIEDCLFANTDGTAPEAGIDFEPNQANEGIENCVVRRCSFVDNSGAGILIYLKNLTAETPPVSLRFEHCLVRGGKDCGIGIGAIADNGPKGEIVFDTCVIESPAAAGAYIYDKSAAATAVRFINCQWNNVWAKRRAGDAPILMHYRNPELVKDFGGISFEACPY